MIHFHGAEITPRSELLRLAGRHFCVSFAYPGTVEVCHEIGQSVLLDNGAFTLAKGDKKPWWPGYVDWLEEWLEYRTTWAIIPDVIGGTEAENDALLDWWDRHAGHLGRAQVAPVWHIHQPVERLQRLCRDYARVCIGSSGGEYRNVGAPAWRARMDEAMNELCGDGPPPTWLHLLRGLAMRGSEYPFASADSSMISQEWNAQAGRRGYIYDVVEMARKIDAIQCPSRWRVREPAARLAHNLPEPPWGDDVAHRTAHRTDQLSMPPPD